MFRFAILIIGLFSVPASAERWLQFSDTDQGRRFVDLHSVRRDGRYATINTQLRMKPVVERQEKFDCISRKFLGESWVAPMDSEGGLHLPVIGKPTWIPIEQSDDFVRIFRIACRSR